MNNQHVSVTFNGKTANIGVYENTIRGTMMMHVEGVRKLAEDFASIAYSTLVKQHRIADCYEIVKVNPANPGTGSYVQFADPREA